MKLQWERYKLRLRLAPAEMAALLAGETLALRNGFGGAFDVACHLRLADQERPSLTGSAADWQVSLPSAQIAALAERLPARDGLRWRLGELELAFDVDVRAKPPRGD